MKTWAYFLVIVLLVSGCSFHTQISKIRYEPQKYEGRQISIKGKVSETLGLPFVQKGIYQVDDGTGKIWVVSQIRRPYRGEEVTVKGELKTGLSIHSQTFGMAIVEGDEEDR